jgi:TRAP-type C4-dicarboxylate transport system permease small subunit
VVGGLLFVTMFLCFVVQVLARYVFNRPQGWTDEVAVFLFVVLACWSAATMTSWREHVTLDVLVTALPARLRRWVRAVGLLAMAATFALAVPATFDLTLYMAGKYTPVLDLNLGVLAGAFLLFLVVFALRAVWTAVTGDHSAADPS